MAAAAAAAENRMTAKSDEEEDEERSPPFQSTLLSLYLRICGYGSLLVRRQESMGVMKRYAP